MKTQSLRWLVAIAAFANNPAPAAATTDAPIDEITVVADYRERTLADVPFSVSVFDAELIEDVAVQHFEELINLVPNMNWSGDGHRARYYQIRGVGELEQYEGAPNPSIGFLIDDIDFSGIGTVATLFDIESVEVLRGPQGSRYGANALGGLVYMRSAAPSAEQNGRVRLSVGGDDTRALGAAVSTALNSDETLAARVSVHRYESNGFRDNVYLGREDSNGRDETTLRGRLQFTPSDSLTVNLALLYADVDNGYDAFAIDNSFQMLSDKPGKDAQQSLGVSLRFDWPLAGGLGATSISAYADSDIDFSFDADWGNADSWSPVTYDYVSVSERARRTLSQELRLGNERWLLGFYALRLADDTETLNRGDYYDPFYDFADSLDDSFASDYASTNVAVFGQYSYALTAATELEGGLRLERRETDYSDKSGLQTGPGESLWGGELSLRHEFAAPVSGYLSLSRGYKAGGFNLGMTPAGQREFGAETMVTLEAGLKTQWADGALRLNVAAFHYRRDNQQVRTSVQLVPGDPASFVFFTDNIGKGEGNGVEADVRWLLSEHWELYGGVGLLDAAFSGGRELAHAPGYTLSAGVAWYGSGGWFARADIAAKDAFYFDVSHDQKSQPYELLNLRAGYAGERWQASVWARNLTDENYAVRGFYFGNEPPDFPDTLYTRFGDPRQLGLTIERRF